jgi:LmbE family N-acetylglucosaminyl deacetylase
MNDTRPGPLNAGILAPRILTVYPHPDDESFGPAAVLAKYARRGAVITFGPGGITRHPDHLAVSQATTRAVHHALDSGAQPMMLYYDAVRPQRAEQFGVADLPDGQPNTWIDVSDTADVKLDALRCHARHIKDAQQRLEQLEREPETVATLYRALPDVPPGLRLTGLLTDETG